MDILAERLRIQRARCGMSQKMVSIRLNVGQSNVSAWENGIKNPTLPMLVRLAEIYGVTADYLLGITDMPLSAIHSHSPYAEVTVHEKLLLEAYRKASIPLQGAVCDILHINHPVIEQEKAHRTR